MKIRKGDKVKILSGKDKGVESTVLAVFIDKNKVLVENVNVLKKHVKATDKKEGGIQSITKPINVSNVMLICPKTQKPTRIGYKIVDGKKYRVSKKSNEFIDK